MFYMPKYHNLSDGRQVFLRFPDPVRHALPVQQMLAGVPQGAEAEVFLSAANADPMRLVLIAEIAGQVAGCGFLQLTEPVQRQVAVQQEGELKTLMETALAEVAAQKGVAL